MRYERLWERLVESLSEVGAVSEPAPGRLVVAVDKADDDAGAIEVVMTRDQWDEMASVAFGEFDSAASYVRSRLLAQPRHERFLVYGSYDLVPSATPELPADPEEEHLTELARQHPEGIGHWVVLDSDGNEVDSFGPPD